MKDVKDKSEARGLRAKKFPKMTRRRFLGLLGGSAPLAWSADTFLVEPYWLKVSNVRLNEDASLRIVHLSDLHYRGGWEYINEVVDLINGLSADFVCYTGDIVERSAHLEEALKLMAKISCPVYGVPGNHDYSSGASFKKIDDCLKSTGGGWLVDEQTEFAGGEVRIAGASGLKKNLPANKAFSKSVLLVHYPDYVNKLDGERFDLVMAGHSHGGQVRIPGLGALIVPYRVGKYDKGLFNTPAGPLYVNVGIGTLLFPMRFCCRPEIAVIEL